MGPDLHVWRGDQVNAPLPPTGRVMGHEGVGVVYKLGQGVTTDSLGTPIKEGDRLMHVAVFPCYRCHICIRGDYAHCVNRGYSSADVYPYFTGTYADFFYLPPLHPAFRVPDALPDDILGPVNCATGTVTQGLISAGAHEGQYVVIQGAGGLGLNAIAMAKDMGADRVIVLDRLENRLRLAEGVRRRLHHQHRGVQRSGDARPAGERADQRPWRGHRDGAGRSRRAAG